MSNRIYHQEQITVLTHNSNVVMRVMLPNQPADMPREQRQYAEAELIRYFPNSDGNRMKYRGFAVIQPNDQVQPFGYAVYPWNDGLLAVNQLFLHPEDERDLERYCRYLRKPFSPAELPNYGLHLEIGNHKTLLNIRYTYPGGDGNWVVGALLPPQPGLMGRLAGLAKRFEGWSVFDNRQQDKAR